MLTTEDHVEQQWNHQGLILLLLLLLHKDLNQHHFSFKVKSKC